MLSRLDFRTGVNSASLTDSLPRAAIDIDAALEAVRPLVADVREHGDQALLDQAERFDGVRPETIAVPKQAIDEALAELDPKLVEAIELSIKHVRAGHEGQMPEEKTVSIVPGGTITQRWIPIRRVGLYVPGGLAVYPSSVVMNVVAAQVAGVPSIALTSPAQTAFGGLPHPTILAACALLGIDEVYAAGGAGAIGMFAYGAGSCQPVDVITGPGNIYVAAAKRLVHGTVGIDSEAGTTEIAILADDSANPRYVAADLLSQAEHDPAAASVLITDSVELADAVDRELEELVSATKHEERVRTALSGPQSGTVLVADIDDGLEVVNAYGAEHLEIHTRDVEQVAARVHNAGAIFLGDYTPVPAGDYLAGSNHVLPTGGTARYSSGLGVHAFLKSVQQVTYSREALADITTPLVTFANAEDLPAHGTSLLVRRDEV
ncbi:histidinol dehydrogenase [Flaviflexus ciconiae]|uniref:Histidinol dehydrogenase n=1 Tax=Flaviflexus ciconiae TaxID=2496867 RepID=A0A3Q9G1D1_9ACTO|nr:histidinol dehydrogenase [Flaviflexus ciconiae]AZQ76708.1 histidinol dehydrogenase [Flaviflexus ciconiae]